MDSTTKNRPKAKPKNSRPYSSHWYMLLLVFVFVFLIALAASINQNKTKPAPPAASAPSLTGSMTMTTDQSTITAGSAVKMSVWEDSGDKSVNAVQANITYPTDKVQIMSLDSSDSAFLIQALARNKNGEIMIVRGQIGGLIGKQLVSVINLKAKATGEAKLAFIDGTVLMSSETSKNILGQTTDLNLTIKAKQ